MPVRTALLALALVIGAAPAATAKTVEPVLEAHRGGPDLGAPENTIKLFKKAVASKVVDRIETDVRTTEDDVLVIHHDATLSKKCTKYGGKSLRVLTWKQLATTRCDGQPVPRVEDAYDVVRGTDVALNLELKLDADKTLHERKVFARELARSVVASKLPDDQVTFSSFYWRSYATTLRKYAPDHEIVAMEFQKYSDPTADTFSSVREAKAAGIDLVTMSIADAHRDVLAFITGYGGMEVTLNARTSEADSRYALAHGLRIYPSDDPERAAASIKAFQARVAKTPLKQSLKTTNKAATVLAKVRLADGRKTFPRLVSSSLLKASSVKRLDGALLDVTVTGSGGGTVEVAPSGSRPGTDGTRVAIPKGTKTYRVVVGPGDAGRLRVVPSGAAATVTVKLVGYRTASY